jgi:hypothetical protein
MNVVNAPHNNFKPKFDTHITNPLKRKLNENEKQEENSQNLSLSSPLSSSKKAKLEAIHHHHQNSQTTMISSQLTPSQSSKPIKPPVQIDISGIDFRQMVRSHTTH